jgi:type III secretion protein S
MTPHDAMISQVHIALRLMMYITLPPLLAATIVGLTVGILQAVTQVQDQSLPMMFKLFAVVMVLAIAGSALAIPLENQATQLFDYFPTMVR